MIIHVPQEYYSDEYMHSSLKNKRVKEKLKRELGVEKLAIRYSTYDNSIYCSDASKNELVNKLIMELL